MLVNSNKGDSGAGRPIRAGCSDCGWRAGNHPKGRTDPLPAAGSRLQSTLRRTGGRLAAHEAPPPDPTRIVAPAAQAQEPPRPPPRRGPWKSIDSRRSAADAEDLAAAVGANALSRGLAVLHRDLLGVLNNELLLVLDAVALCHCSKPPSDDGAWPLTLVVVPTQASVPDADE